MSLHNILNRDLRSFLRRKNKWRFYGTKVPDLYYREAMQIRTQEEADKYFKALIDHLLGAVCRDRKLMEAIQRRNLAYYAAAYCDHATRLRIEEFFKCEHHRLGPAKDREYTAEELFQYNCVRWGHRKILGRV